MAQIKKIKDDNLKIEYELIFDSIFRREGDGALDYLHLLRMPSYLTLPFCVVRDLDDARKRYEEYSPIMSRNLVNFYVQNVHYFVPEAVVRAPTSKPELQQPLFDLFVSAFPEAIDLSSFLSKKPDGQGVNKFSLSGWTGDLSKVKNIVVIDDVYGEGHAMASIISCFGVDKSFIAICPLVVNPSNGLSTAFRKLKLPNITDRPSHFTEGSHG